MNRDIESLAHMVVEYLEVKHTGLAGRSGVDLFIDREPATPNDCVTIFNTGGSEQNPNYTIDTGTVQVRIRGISYDEAYRKIRNITNVLQSLDGYRTMAGELLVGCWVTTPVFPLPHDDNNRFIFVVNLRLTKELNNINEGNRREI
ncbi:hypothetical protein AB832_07160 [Flavobacteriaceae bacterium (ex Bugula neritina AB1)]|nr:hypothetical protein AB832_07160 [Flavobacteriaceae bacterium (ex Bugula neritina AB1)]